MLTTAQPAANRPAYPAPSSTRLGHGASGADSDAGRRVCQAGSAGWATP